MRDLGDSRRNLLRRLLAWDAALAQQPFLRLEGPGLGAPAGWFLGPKAENKPLLQELIADAIEQHCDYRKSYQPGDPEIITGEVKQSQDYQAAVATLRKSAAELNAVLKRSAPTFSMRSHGHMLWDQVLPAMVGYFAGMLYNQNNVASEASPVTTWLELQVGNDLCRMLGYEVPPQEPPPSPDAIVPWGHITCDGSVANIEALWAARNIKFFGVALRAALREVPLLAPARNIEVQLLDGSKRRLIDLDTWTSLNLKVDDLVALPYRITAIIGSSLDSRKLNAVLKPYLLQNVGILEFYQRFMSGFPQAPVAMVPSTSHYSWPKAGTMLGLGQNNVLKVRVDMRARMFIPDLVDKLHHCLLKRIPLIAVVAVIGSTEESAVDPLSEILKVREQFRKEGLDFAVHCDAAWGGYFNTMYQEEDQALAFKAVAPAPEFPMSNYVAEQYRSLAKADSITVDPHKAGYAPYPAGALCYRNSALRDVISLAAPVVFHSQLEPTVGIYGIEGSKPGAAAAAVYLAHKVIRPTKQGYGKILGECVWVSKRMYCRLLTMQDRDPRQPSLFKIVLFQMLPAERDGLGPDAVKQQRDMVADFVPRKNADLKALLNTRPKARELFEELGSDQVILAFAFNFLDPATGDWNQDGDKLNALNNKIFEICSITSKDENPQDINLILTSSQFDAEAYGSVFVEHYARRLGLSDAKSISFLISTTMNPWTTDTTIGDFLEVVESALRDAVYQGIKELGFASPSDTIPPDTPDGE
jgi:glutamate/tyrosine decarboxylase-like PLP-dependent enzyme